MVCIDGSAAVVCAVLYVLCFVSVGPLAISVTDSRNGLGLSAVTICAGVGLNALCLAGRSGGYHALVPCVIRILGLTACAALCMLISIGISPLTEGVSRSRNGLGLGSVTICAGVGLNALCLAGRIGGYNTLVPCVIRVFGLTACAVLCMLISIGISPLTESVSGGRNSLGLGSVTIRAGVGLNAVSLAGRIGGYYAAIPCVICINGRTAVVCAVLYVLLGVSVGPIAISVTDSSHRLGSRSTTTNTSEGLNALRLASRIRGHRAVIPCVSIFLRSQNVAESIVISGSYICIINCQSFFGGVVIQIEELSRQ